MMIEENVDVKNNPTEEVAGANGAGGAEREALTVLGKFKDVDALARAYEALQAEFTRRSQKLRALEKEAENFRKQAALSGAEKLRKTALSRREETKAFDEFVAEVDSQAERKPDEWKETLVEAELNGGVEEHAALANETIRDSEKKALMKAEKEPCDDGDIHSSQQNGEEGELPHVRKNVGDAFTSEELFQRAFDDEEVRLRIVGEYLTSLGRSGAPVTGKGTGVLTTPPAKAKTVGQAGDMALLYFQKN